MQRPGRLRSFTGAVPPYSLAPLRPSHRFHRSNTPFCLAAALLFLTMATSTILDLAHSLQGISLAPSPVGVTQLADPVASMRVRLEVRPVESQGYAYLTRSRIYRYVDCHHVTSSTKVVRTAFGGAPPAGRRLGFCCIGAGLVDGHYAAGVVVERLVAKLRAHLVAEERARFDFLPTATLIRPNPVPGVTLSVKQELLSSPSLARFRDPRDDHVYHTQAACISVNSDEVEVLTEVAGRTQCSKCAAVEAVARRLMSPGKACNEHVVVAGTPLRPGYQVGYSYWVNGAQKVHGHPACPGLNKTAKQVQATRTRPPLLSNCRLCDGPGSTTAAVMAG